MRPEFHVAKICDRDMQINIFATQGAGLMRIKNSLQFVLGLVLAAFIFSGTAKAVTTDTIIVGNFGANDSYIGVEIFNQNTVDTFEFTYIFTLTESPLVVSTLLNEFEDPEFTNVQYDWITDGDGINPQLYTGEFLQVVSGVTSLIITGNVSTTNGAILNLQITAVPVPPAAILFGSALLGIGFLSRRRKKKQKKPLAIAA